MRTVLWLVLASCSSGKSQQPEYVDDWTTRPREAFANKLTEDRLDNPATVAFTIQLPKGMFHDPRSTPEKAHYYGVWNADGFNDVDAPFVGVRLAPYGAKTLDAFASDATIVEQLTSKRTLDDGTWSVTTHVGTHSWRVQQMHFDDKGRAVYCSASRHDEKHARGDATRRMLEEMCSSLTLTSAQSTQ